MRARRAGLALALVLVGASPALAAHKPGSARNPVRITAAFDRDARLGGSAALTLGLHVDTGRLRSPVTALRLSYPRELGIVSSGLGLEACDRPQAEFAAVLVNTRGLGGCPRNAVMGYGTARAIVRLVANGQVIPEYATVSLLSGPIEDGKLKLVIYIDGQRPFGARLLLAGAATSARRPYGGALDVVFPQIAGLRDLAIVSLSDLEVTIGSPRIRYVDRGRRYRPEAVVLPNRCPRQRFRFRLDLTFEDGSRRHTGTTLDCPAAPGPQTQRR